MLRLLLKAGATFATLDIGLRIARFKRSASYFAVAGLLGLLGFGALTAAAAIYLERYLGAAGSAAAVGGGLLVLAALIGWIGSRAPRPVRTPTPVVDRVRAELGAAASAVSSARAARAARIDDDVQELRDAPLPGQRRKRTINMVLIATLAGVILGRRL